MSGKPHFSRAKRYKFFHTSHTSTFEGSETQHVKTNLNASVDGDYAIVADAISVTGDSIDLTGAVTENTARTAQLDMGQQKIVNVENLLRSVKRTVSYTEFTASSRKFPQVIGIYRASPGDTIVDVVANMTAPFASASLMGTGAKATKETPFSAGDKSATGGFKTSADPESVGWLWMVNNGTRASMGEYLQSDTGTPLTKHYRAGTMINISFRASDYHLASLDQGTVDFYVDVMSRS